MMQKSDRTKLLPSNALENKCLGISVSESPDLDRLGLLDIHFQMMLGELVRTVIISGGSLYYGGDLRSKGITAFLVEELHRYGRRDRSLKVCLAWSVHQSMSAEQIAEQKKILGLFGEIYFLSPDGRRINDLDNKLPPQTFSLEESAASLSGLRVFMADNTDARIVLGGKREDFKGRMPGIFEEVLLSLERRQALYLVGGFGGATFDVIQTLRPTCAEWLPPLSDNPPLDERVSKGLEKISETAIAMKWDGYENGLSDEENSLLSASYRPSEVAALVGRGLGKL